MDTLISGANLVLFASLAFHFAIQVIGAMLLRAARNKIGGTIKSSTDLDHVRAAIQVNLLLGIPIICNCIVLMIALIYSTRLAWLLGLAVLAAGQIVTWINFRPIEKQFKVLPVEADLADEYHNYVTQWSGARFFLKPYKKP
jgi:hypothetical protein